MNLQNMPDGNTAARLMYEREMDKIDNFFSEDARENFDYGKYDDQLADLIVDNPTDAMMIAKSVIYALDNGITDLREAMSAISLNVRDFRATIDGLVERNSQ